MTDQGHLSIGEVLGLLQAEFPDVTISKIRFLESQGLLDPERTPSGYRKFYETDIDRLRWILAQQRENFLPLKVIKERLEARDAAVREGRPIPDLDAVAPHPTPETLFAGQPEAAPAPVPVWMADVARPPAADTANTERRTSDSEAADSPSRAAPAPAPAESTAGTSDKLARPNKQPNDRPRVGRASSPAPTPLDSPQTSVSLTLDELATASGLAAADLRELESYGLLEGQRVGADTYYDGDALVIAQKSAVFIGHGIEPRHLRMFKVAAEREAGFLEQVVMPMVKQKDPAGKRQAVERLGELAALGQTLRAALLRHALRDHLAPPP